MKFTEKIFSVAWQWWQLCSAWNSAICLGLVFRYCFCADGMFFVEQKWDHRMSIFVIFSCLFRCFQFMLCYKLPEVLVQAFTYITFCCTVGLLIAFNWLQETWVCKVYLPLVWALRLSGHSIWGVRSYGIWHCVNEWVVPRMILRNTMPAPSKHQKVQEELQTCLSL